VSPGSRRTSVTPGPKARARTGRAWAIALEIVAAVAAATGVMALLLPTASAAGLEVLYLLAVLTVAIRHGERPALITAVLSVLTVNYLFIPPRHEFVVERSQDLVDLIVLMVAAVVVGRLASIARERAAEAEERAGQASAREREATLLAQVASAILAGQGLAHQLDSVGTSIARAVGATRARVAIESVPSPAEGELTRPLRTRSRRAWLYVSPDTDWERPEIERICEPLARLLDVAMERERVAEAAAEAEATRRGEVARTAVLHAISHDLRSPLTAIATAGSGLRGQLDAEDRQELLGVIEDQTARLAKLVDDLLDLSKIEAGGVAPRADWCDLGDVVTGAAAHLHSRHPIEFTLPDDLPLVRADAAQLERVFVNLLDNAIRFSPADVPVEVHATAAAGHVTVRVLDHGTGVRASDRPHIFEAFFRGEDGQRRGSGLGLAICRGFVEANGGEIALAGDRRRGTSFQVTFPAASAPATRTPA
jgi:two-component system sensor histidine kinase KdpD